MCDFCGLAGGRALPPSRSIVSKDRFVSPNARQAGWFNSTLQTSSLPLIGAPFGLRQKGFDWERTDMGHVVDGRVLKSEDFDLNTS